MAYLAHILLFLSVPLFVEGVICYMQFSLQAVDKKIEMQFWEAQENNHPAFRFFALYMCLSAASLTLGSLLLQL